MFPVVRVACSCSAKGDGDLLQEIERVLQAGFHPGVDDRVTESLVRSLYEEGERGAAVHLGERRGVQRPFSSDPFGRPS